MGSTAACPDAQGGIRAARTPRLARSISGSHHLASTHSGISVSLSPVCLDAVSLAMTAMGMGCYPPCAAGHTGF